MVLVLTLVVGGLIQLLLLNSYEKYTCKKVYVSDGCCCIESGSYVEALWKEIRDNFRALDSVSRFIKENGWDLLQIMVLILWGIGLVCLFLWGVPKVPLENTDKAIKEYFEGSAVKEEQSKDVSEENIETDNKRNRKGIVDTIEESIGKATGIRWDINKNGVY